MSSSSASKLILPIVLFLLIQCHNTEAGKMANLMQSILDTLKSIESLLKDENAVVDNKSAITYETVNGGKINAELIKLNENLNSNTNNTIDEVTEKQMEEEPTENTFSSFKEKQIHKKLGRRNSNANQNINQNINQNQNAHWPKLRSIMEMNDPKKKIKLIAKNSNNESDRKNEDIVKRLFEPSSEEFE